MSQRVCSDILVAMKSMLLLVGLLSLSHQLVSGFDVLQNVPALSEAKPRQQNIQHRRTQSQVDIKAFLAFREWNAVRHRFCTARLCSTVFVELCRAVAQTEQEALPTSDYVSSTASLQLQRKSMLWFCLTGMSAR